jgi:hypothetical protein
VLWSGVIVGAAYVIYKTIGAVTSKNEKPIEKLTKAPIEKQHWAMSVPVLKGTGWAKGKPTKVVSPGRNTWSRSSLIESRGIFIESYAKAKKEPQASIVLYWNGEIRVSSESKVFVRSKDDIHLLSDTKIGLTAPQIKLDGAVEAKGNVANVITGKLKKPAKQEISYTPDKPPKPSEVKEEKKKKKK